MSRTGLDDAELLRRYGPDVFRVEWSSAVGPLTGLPDRLIAALGRAGLLDCESLRAAVAADPCALRHLAGVGPKTLEAAEPLLAEWGIRRISPASEDQMLMPKVVARAEQSIEFRRELYRVVSGLMGRLPLHPDKGTIDITQAREGRELAIELEYVIAEAVTRDQTQIKRFVLRCDGVYHVECRYLADADEAEWRTICFSKDPAAAVNSYNRLS